AAGAARPGERIGRPLGLSAVETAAAILRVANDRMASAIRLVSLEQGHDPRDFALLAFGGAGPLHAVALARELGVPRGVVPPLPSITSTLGCLIADVRPDVVPTINVRPDKADRDRLKASLDAPVARGRRLLADEAVPPETIEASHEADLQFDGQSHVLRLPLTRPFDLDALRATFLATYRERFAVELPGIPVRLVSLRTTVQRR